MSTSENPGQWTCPLHQWVPPETQDNGFVMIGSIDSMHWTWKNYRNVWQKAYGDKKESKVSFWKRWHHLAATRYLNLDSFGVWFNYGLGPLFIQITLSTQSPIDFSFPFGERSPIDLCAVPTSCNYVYSSNGSVTQPYFFRNHKI